MYLNSLEPWLNMWFEGIEVNWLLIERHVSDASTYVCSFFQAAIFWLHREGEFFGTSTTQRSWNNINIYEHIWNPSSDSPSVHPLCPTSQFLPLLLLIAIIPVDSDPVLSGAHWCDIRLHSCPPTPLRYLQHLAWQSLGPWWRKDNPRSANPTTKIQRSAPDSVHRPWCQRNPRTMWFILSMFIFVANSTVILLGDHVYALPQSSAIVATGPLPISTHRRCLRCHRLHQRWPRRHPTSEDFNQNPKRTGTLWPIVWKTSSCGWGGSTRKRS